MGERLPRISRRWRPLALLGLLTAVGIYWSLVLDGVESLRNPSRPTAAPATSFTPSMPAPPPKPRRAATGVPAEEPAPAADAAPLREVRVTVVVKDGGAPIAGAEVRVCAASDENERPRVVTAVTGADGVAVLSTDRRQVRSLTVRKIGFLVDRESDRNTPVDIRVALTAAVAIRGRVVLADTRAPAVGVSVQGFEGRTGTSGSIDVPQVTDADGRFELAGAPPDDDVRVFAVAPGYCWADAIIAKSNVGQEVELVLGEGGVLEGTVTDGDGTPLPGIEVFTLPESGSVPKPDWAWDEESQSIHGLYGFIFPAHHTDANGHFEFRGVILPREGASPSRIAAARSADGHESRSEPVTFKRHGERQRRDIRFPKPSSITVRATPASALPGGATARVRHDGARSGDPKRFAEGSNVAEFPDLLPDTYVVSVESANVAGDGGKSTVTRRIDLGDGEHASVEIPIGGPSRVTGRVVDDLGNGLDDARVEFTSADSGSGLEFDCTTTTASDGSFALENVPAATGALHVEMSDTFRHSGDAVHEFGHARADVGGVVPGGAPTTITLERLARLTAKLVPVPDRRNGKVRVRAGGNEEEADFVVADDGSFACELPHVGSGAITWIEFDGYAPTFLDPPPPAPGTTRDLGATALSAGATFDARIVDAAGRPLARVGVRALDPWMIARFEATDGDGRVRFARVPRHRMQVRISATDVTPTTVLVVEDPTAGPVAFTVGAGALVSGAVRDADGRTVANASVLWVCASPRVDADDANDVVTSDANGRYELRIQAGRGILGAQMGDATSKQVDLTVADGEKRSLDFVLR